MRLNVDQTTEAWPEFAAELISAGSREQRGHSLSQCAGLWQSEANVTSWLNYPVHEFMILLTGQVSIIEKERTSSFKAGDCFVIPKGLRCIWSQIGQVRKWYVANTDGCVVSGPSDRAFKVEPHSIKWATDSMEVYLRSFQAGEILSKDTIVHAPGNGGDFYVRAGEKCPVEVQRAIYCSWNETKPKL